MPFTATKTDRAAMLVAIESDPIFKRRMKWGHHSAKSRAQTNTKNTRLTSKGITTISDRIETLRQRYEEGCRKMLYDTLAETMAVALALRADPVEAAAFCKRAGKKYSQSNKRRAEEKLTCLLVTYVTRIHPKLGWKRARVLNYMVDDLGIDPENLAREIAERGGIESIANIAAREKPRRKQKGVIAKAVSKREARKQLAKSPAQVQSQSTESDQWDSFIRDDKGNQRDGITAILVHVTAAQKAEIEAIPPGRHVELICTRPAYGTSPAVAAVLETVHLL